ncbi:MAG: hypothetical protein SF162_16395 [bacterium]|nr:hypothetical protein [bacterium]
MTFTSGSNGQADLPIEQFLSAVTDAVQSGRHNVDALVEKYALSSEEADEFIRLIRGLAAALVLVRPSKEFSAQLKRDLIGAPERTFIERLLFLPPRVQIAAVAALGAGLWLLARRRYTALVEADGEGKTEIAPAG